MGKRWEPGQYVVDDRQAEQMAAWAMRGLGYADAVETGAGADGGIDVRARGAIAQVKFRGGQTGAPDLQRLVGARGRREDLQLLFFTASGYSSRAVEYADDMEVALFTYDPLGTLTPRSAAARRMVDRVPDTPASAPNVSEEASPPQLPPSRLHGWQRMLPLVAVLGWPAVIWAFTQASQGAMSWLSFAVGTVAVTMITTAVIVDARERRGRPNPRVLEALIERVFGW